VEPEATRAPTYWTLPNLLTFFRLGLLPVVLWLIHPGLQTPARVFWASLVYVLAGVLDVLDGYLARRIGQVTSFGKFLDPLVDKLFHLLTLISMQQLPGLWVPTWVVMLVLIRELGVTGMRAMASTEGLVIAAGQGGKVKTTFAVAGMCALLIHYPYAVHVGWTSYVIDPYKIGMALTCISLFFSISSAWQYGRGFILHHRANS
jgi:CDP-diacylglycerol--glycerol-3-phosphate 3-phosphatidyltransferase